MVRVCVVGSTVPATFFVKTLTDCWCYGDYTLSATVSGVGTD